jgi:hypothetical protein
MATTPADFTEKLISDITTIISKRREIVELMAALNEEYQRLGGNADSATAPLGVIADWDGLGLHFSRADAENAMGTVAGGIGNLDDDNHLTNLYKIKR